MIIDAIIIGIIFLIGVFTCLLSIFLFLKFKNYKFLKIKDYKSNKDNYIRKCEYYNFVLIPRDIELSMIYEDSLYYGLHIKYYDFNIKNFLLFISINLK